MAFRSCILGYPLRRAASHQTKIVSYQYLFPIKMLIPQLSATRTDYWIVGTVVMSRLVDFLMIFADHISIQWDGSLHQPNFLAIYEGLSDPMDVVRLLKGGDIYALVLLICMNSLGICTHNIRDPTADSF